MHLLFLEWFPIKKHAGPHDWRYFTEYPFDLQDKHAWGNIIAAREQELFETLTKKCKRIDKSNQN